MGKEDRATKNTGEVGEMVLEFRYIKARLHTVREDVKKENIRKELVKQVVKFKAKLKYKILQKYFKKVKGKRERITMRAYDSVKEG